jgi:hypothetical protein
MSARGPIFILRNGGADEPVAAIGTKEPEYADGLTVGQGEERPVMQTAERELLHGPGSISSLPLRDAPRRLHFRQPGGRG